MLGAKAPGADLHPLPLAVYHQVYRMNVGLELSWGMHLGMTDVSAKPRHFIAYCTLCHCVTTL